MFCVGAYHPVSTSCLGYLSLFSLVFCSSRIIGEETDRSHVNDVPAAASFRQRDHRLPDSNFLSEGFLLANNSHNMTTTPRLPVLYNTSSTTCETQTSTERSRDAPPSYSNWSSGDDTELQSFVQVLDEQVDDAEAMIDGSGQTTDTTAGPTTDQTAVTSELWTTQSTTTSPRTTTTTRTTTSTPQNIILSNSSTFEIEVNCTNANTTVQQLLKEFEKEFNASHQATIVNESVFNCNETKPIKIELRFITENDHSIINRLFETLDNITKRMDVVLYTRHECSDSNEPVKVVNVTKCYIIDLCGLCGRDPPRGVCDPAGNASRCRCFANELDPDSPYEGDRCLSTPRKPVLASPARWPPVAIGILAGLSALLGVIVIGVAVMTYRRRKRRPSERDTPTPDSISDAETPPVINQSPQADTLDDAFFAELDQMLDNALYSAIPDEPPARRPSFDTISTQSIYDPIHELDKILDHAEIEFTYANSTLEAFNPRFPPPDEDSIPY